MKYHKMRQATKGHAGCACAGKRDFVSRKTPKRSHFSRPVDVRLAPTVAVAKTAKRGAIRVSCPFVGQLIK